MGLSLYRHRSVSFVTNMTTVTGVRNPQPNQTQPRPNTTLRRRRQTCILFELTSFTAVTLPASATGDLRSRWKFYYVQWPQSEGHALYWDGFWHPFISVGSFHPARGGRAQGP